MVKRILSESYLCRRHEGRSYFFPPPPPLPAFRVQESPPFTSTGVDHCMSIVQLEVSIRCGLCCTHVVLPEPYTCCVTRAVHLDLVSDKSTPTFICTFKRFSSRIGLPSLMLSDNGKMFVAAAKVVTKVVTSPKVQEYFEGIGIQWKFNVPRAPWWGGVFERLVRSTKQCLRKVLGQAKFSHDELLTALIEIEMVLNFRPLTYISENDLDEALTPSHLLIGRRLMNLPDHVLQPNHDDDGDEKGFKLNSRSSISTAHSIAGDGNTYWSYEKLIVFAVPIMDCRCLRETFVVYSDDKPRSCWKIGRVEHIIEGALILILISLIL